MFCCQVFWGFSALHFHFLPAANQTWDWGPFFPISLKGIVWHFQTMHLHPGGRRAGKPRCDCLVYCLLVKIEAIVTSQVAPINKIESINVVWRWSVMIPRYVSYFHVIIFLILSESLMSLNPNLSGFEDQSVVWHVMPKLSIWNGHTSGLEPDCEQHC